HETDDRIGDAGSFYGNPDHPSDDDSTQPVAGMAAHYDNQHQHRRLTSASMGSTPFNDSIPEHVDAR
ncbi:hypothetical protein IWW37_006096, partial [Coemansia sp. RSA 2050]